MSEKHLGATLFPITGLPQQAFRLRVLRVPQMIVGAGALSVFAMVLVVR